jgi:predicted kinase
MDLFIIRGIPGSGKSTFAKNLATVHFEADMFFMDENGVYNFDASRLSEAHSWCRNAVKDAMKDGVDKIAVSNTFTRKWEMEPYILMAEEFGYRVFSVIVENRHGGENLHSVPEEKIEEMRNRFEIKL